MGSHLEATAAIHALTSHNLRLVIGCTAIVRAIVRNGEARDVVAFSITIPYQRQETCDRSHGTLNQNARKTALDTRTLCLNTVQVEVRQT